MIEGTTVANEFEKIYASSFYYDENGEAKWPAQVINYTSKTQEGVSKAQKRPQYKSKLATLVKYT